MEIAIPGQNFADPSAEGTLLLQSSQWYRSIHAGSLDSRRRNCYDSLMRITGVLNPCGKVVRAGVASIKRVVIKNIDEWGTRLSMLQAGDADDIYAPPQYRPQLEPIIKTVLRN